MKSVARHSQEAQRTQHSRNIKKIKPTDMVVKLMKPSVQTTGRCLEKKRHKNDNWCLVGNCKLEDGGVTSLTYGREPGTWSSVACQNCLSKERTKKTSSEKAKSRESSSSVDLPSGHTEGSLGAVGRVCWVEMVTLWVTMTFFFLIWKSFKQVMDRLKPKEWQHIRGYGLFRSKVYGNSSA